MTVVALGLPRMAIAHGPQPALHRDPVSEGQQELPAVPVVDELSRARALAAELFARQQLSLVAGKAYRDGIQLEGSTFYQVIGRRDLADRYRQRQQAKSTGTAVGTVLLTGGVVWGLGDLMLRALVGGFVAIPCALLSDGTSPPRDSACGPVEPNPVPWLVAVGGGTVALVSVAAEADPVNAAERQRLAHAYNLQTAAGLNLSRLEAVGRSLRIAGGPVAGGHGGMMTARAEF